MKRSNYGAEALVPLGSLKLELLDCAYLRRNPGGPGHKIGSMCSVPPSILASSFLPLLSSTVWCHTNHQDHNADKWHPLRARAPLHHGDLGR